MQRRWAVGCMLAALAGAASSSNADDPPRVQRADPPRTITDFELTDQNGKPRRFSALRGAPVLVFFGFAHCPDVCPTALNQLRLLRASGDKDARRAEVVIISVDGERDSPAAMKAFLDPISADFVGLTGPAGRVRDIAAQFSAVFFKGLPQGKSAGYRVDHTGQVYLVDKAGRLRATFFNAPVETLQTFTAKIARERL